MVILKNEEFLKFLELTEFAVEVEATRLNQKVSIFDTTGRNTIAGKLLDFRNAKSYQQNFLKPDLKKLSSRRTNKFWIESKKLLFSAKALNHTQLSQIVILIDELNKIFELVKDSKPDNLDEGNSIQNKNNYPSSSDHSVSDSIELMSNLKTLLNSNWNCFEVSSKSLVKKLLSFKDSFQRHDQIEVELKTTETKNTEFLTRSMIKTWRGKCCFLKQEMLLLIDFINSDDTQEQETFEVLSYEIPVDANKKLPDLLAGRIVSNTKYYKQGIPDEDGVVLLLIKENKPEKFLVLEKLSDKMIHTHQWEMVEDNPKLDNLIYTYPIDA